MIARRRADQGGGDPIDGVGRADVHVAGHERVDDHVVVVESHTGTAQLAALVVPETDGASRRCAGGEPIGRDPTDHVLAAYPTPDLGQSVAFAVGELAWFELDAGSLQ